MELTVDSYSIAPIQEKDAWRLCDFVVINEDYLKAFFPETLRENLTPTLAELFVHRKQRQFHQKDEYLFVIKENVNRTIVGLIYVKELLKKPGQGELAYCIGYRYANKGLMTKFVRAIMAWCFSETMLTNLQIIVHESNGASIRVAKKLGFNFVGILTNEHRMPDGQLADMQLYELEKNTFPLN